MKNLLFTLIATIICLNISGQSIIEKHYKPLENEKNATVVYVSGNLFGYVAKVMPSEEEDLKKAKGLLESITSFSLISVPDLVDPKSEYQKGISTLRETHEDLIAIRDKGNNFSFMINEEDNIIKELVGIGTTDSTFVVFSLLGNMNIDQISKITEMIQEKKELPISATRSKAITEFKVYPNPVAKSSILKINVPEDMVGGQLNVVDISGRVIKSIDATSTTMEVSLDEATLGSCFIDITKGDVSMKKQVLIIE